MNTWLRRAVFAALLLAGAFGMSLAVAEWRKPDLEPIDQRLEEIDTNIERLARQIEVVAPVQPTPFPLFAEPTPGTQVEVSVVGNPGATAEWRGMRVSIESIEMPAPPPGTEIDIILAIENFDAPFALLGGFDRKAVDIKGFTCSSDTALPYVSRGEKVRAIFPIFCDAALKTLTIGGIRFEFAEP